MPKLLISTLSNFQAGLLLWLEVAARAQVPGVTLDLSTLEIEEDADGTGSYVELSNVAFQLCTDDTWRSIWRYVDCDEDGDEYIADGDVLVSGQRDPSSLVLRTVGAMATYFLDIRFEHEHGRFEDEADIYQLCRRVQPDYGGGYCGCWRCRHPGYDAAHLEKCFLCRSIGRTVRLTDENAEIPF